MATVLAALAALTLAAAGDAPDLSADAGVFAKAVTWAERYASPLAPRAAALAEKARRRGQERTAALSAGRHPWTERKGRVVRGFVSAIDGSIQPYGVVVPAGYDGRPLRLDVVLHGSLRPTGTAELEFIDRFDQGDGPGAAPQADFIELHPLGRVENGYRWAGETDVFEAIDDVARKYAVDRDRVVLRGMSAGASGTWHLGLTHPDRFVALGPYCGYVDTHRFSESPMPNFVRVGPLPDYQERTLHMLDSVDWAANAGAVPAIGAVGDQDPFREAHAIMGRAMAAEGLEMVNLISHGTGHVIDPVTHAEQLRRIAEHARRGRDARPAHVRFVTWTLKYPRAFWVEVRGLGRHYQRAEVDARIADDGGIDVGEPANVTSFALLPPAWRPGTRVRVAGVEVALPATIDGSGVVLARGARGWRFAGTAADEAPVGKRPGVQGPIDDAFTSPFLCVRGTGKPWNPRVAAWAEAQLRRFADEWARYFRGDLPVKDDVAVTDDDTHTKNLILFGDPGSNRLIARVLPRLPLLWTRRELRVAGARYPAATHAPVLVNPSPLPGARGRYVVIDGGHTFHAPELSTLNYLLYPRLGDFAVVDVGRDQVVRAGLCDEDWRPM